MDTAGRRSRSLPWINHFLVVGLVILALHCCPSCGDNETTTIITTDPGTTTVDTTQNPEYTTDIENTVDTITTNTEINTNDETTTRITSTDNESTTNTGLITEIATTDSTTSTQTGPTTGITTTDSTTSTQTGPTTEITTTDSTTSTQTGPTPGITTDRTTSTQTGPTTEITTTNSTTSTQTGPTTGITTTDSTTSTQTGPTTGITTTDSTTSTQTGQTTGITTDSTTSTQTGPTTGITTTNNTTSTQTGPTTGITTIDSTTSTQTGPTTGITPTDSTTFTQTGPTPGITTDSTTSTKTGPTTGITTTDRTTTTQTGPTPGITTDSITSIQTGPTAGITTTDRTTSTQTGTSSDSTATYTTSISSTQTETTSSTTSVHYETTTRNFTTAPSTTIFHADNGSNIYCPAAVVNETYRVTSEYYNISKDQINVLNRTWFYNNKVLAECMGKQCNMAAQFTDLAHYFTFGISYFGVNSVQLTVTISSYASTMQGYYSVLWDLGHDKINMNCSVAEGTPVEECSMKDYCVNAVSCTPLASGYDCECKTGYGGMKCDKGDYLIRCSQVGFRLTFFQYRTSCTNMGTACYVAADAGQDNTQIYYNVLSTNFTAAQSSNLTIVDNDKLSLNICSTDQSLEGSYQTTYSLNSTAAISNYQFQVLIFVVESNAPPQFNAKNKVYSINVPETDDGFILYVNKSKTATCSSADNSCIQVTDANSNQSLGVDSLSLSVIEKSGSAASIKFLSGSSSYSFGYFYVSGPMLPGSNITYGLTAKDGGNMAVTADVTFLVIDVNQPPNCTEIAVTVSLDIRSQPGTVVQTVHCIDNDYELRFRKISYSVQGNFASSFRVNDSGTIFVNQSLLALPVKPLEFEVKVDGYTDPPDPAFIKVISVYVNITVPEPTCSLTIVDSPKIWVVNSTVVLQLDCDIKGVDKLTAELTVALNKIFIVETIKFNSSMFIINLDVISYEPGSYNFEVTSSLGGAESKASVVINMYNPPTISIIPLTDHVYELTGVGVSVLNVTAISDVARSRVTTRLINSISPFRYSIVSSSGSLSTGVLTVGSSLEKYLGSVFELVFEAIDSVSNLRATYPYNITVEDTNQPPTCQPFDDTVTVKSNLDIGSVILKLSCTDPDITPAYQIQSYIIKTAPSTVELNISNSGTITLAQYLPPTVKTVYVSVDVSDSINTVKLVIIINIEVVVCNKTTEQYGLAFPDTPVNSFTVVNCPSPHSGEVCRFCSLNQTWGEFNFLNCTREILQNISNTIVDLLNDTSKYTDKDIISVLETIGEKIQNNINNTLILSGDIQKVSEILQNIGNVTKLYKNVTINENTLTKYVTIADILIGADKTMWSEAQQDEDNKEEGAMILDGMDNIAKASLRDEELSHDISINKDNIVMKRASTVEDIYFPDTKDSRSYDPWVLQSNTSAYLPKEAFQIISDKILYSAILYNNATEKFRINPRPEDSSLSGKVLNSNILSFSISANIGALPKPLILSFSMLQSNYSNVSCGFLNTNASSPGQWSTSGCTAVVWGDKYNCSCNHLTNFALLMSPFYDPAAGSNAVLSIISAVGCGISIACLCITIFVYLALWKYVKCDRAVLHLNLCVCFIIAYTIFLAGVDRTENTVGCTVVAALLHYIYLVVFCIMLSEGVEIFKSVSFVFSLDSILWKLIVFSYGVPAVIVAISLGVTRTEGYGTKTSCWLSVKNGVIWAFVGPVLLIIMLNLIILIQVLRIMQKSKQMEHKQFWMRTKSAIRTICVLSPILGLTWIFGVLSVNEYTVVFQYLFAIFNSLQGLTIFICYCLIPHQVQDGFRALRRKHRAKSFDSGLKSMSRSQKGNQDSSDFRGASSPSTSRTNITRRNFKQESSENMDDSGHYSYSGDSEAQANNKHLWNGDIYMQQLPESQRNGNQNVHASTRNGGPTVQEIHATYSSYPDELKSSRGAQAPGRSRAQGRWKKVKDAAKSHHFSSQPGKMATRYVTSHGDVTLSPNGIHDPKQPGGRSFNFPANNHNSSYIKDEPDVDYAFNS